MVSLIVVCIVSITIGIIVFFINKKNIGEGIAGLLISLLFGVVIAFIVGNCNEADIVDKIEYPVYELNGHLYYDDDKGLVEVDDNVTIIITEDRKDPIVRYNIYDITYILKTGRYILVLPQDMISELT